MPERNLLKAPKFSSNATCFICLCLFCHCLRHLVKRCPCLIFVKLWPTSQPPSDPSHRQTFLLANMFLLITGCLSAAAPTCLGWYRLHRFQYFHNIGCLSAKTCRKSALITHYHYPLRYFWLVMARALVGLAIGGIVVPFDNLADAWWILAVSPVWHHQRWW